MKNKLYLKVLKDTDLPFSKISPLLIFFRPAIVSTIYFPSFSVVAIMANTSVAPASKVIPRKRGKPSDPEASTPRN